MAIESETIGTLLKLYACADNVNCTIKTRQDSFKFCSVNIKDLWDYQIIVNIET